MVLIVNNFYLGLYNLEAFIVENVAVDTGEHSPNSRNLSKYHLMILEVYNGCESIRWA